MSASYAVENDMRMTYVISYRDNGHSMKCRKLRPGNSCRNMINVLSSINKGHDPSLRLNLFSFDERTNS